MGVRLDQTGHQGRTVPIDSHCMWRGDWRSCRNHRGNPLALDKHGTWKDWRARAIQNQYVFEQRRAHDLSAPARFDVAYGFSIYIRFQVGLMIS